MATNKIYGILLGTILLAAAEAQAQNQVLKIDIFQPIVNTAALSYERKLSESSSFQLGVSVTAKYPEDGENFPSSYAGRKSSGVGIMPQYRLYLSEKHPAPEGFYVAPYLRYQYLRQQGQYEEFNPATGTSTIRKSDASLNAFGGGIVVGRHWIFKRLFSLDTFLGPSYMASRVSTTNPNVNRDSFLGFYEDSNYGIRGGLTFGFAF